MTPRERLINTLRGKDTDRKPCICPGGMMNMVTAQLMNACGVSLPEAHTDADKMARLALSVYEMKCFENVGVPFCMTVEAEGMGAKVDLGSNVIEPHVIEYLMKEMKDYTRLSSVNFKEGRSKVVLDAIRLLRKQLDEENKDVPVIGNLTGPISTAASLIEPSVFYKSLRKEPEVAQTLLQLVTDELIRFGKEQIRAGADVIAISDPSGTGEILGPRYFSQFAVPYINQLVEAFEQEQIPTIVHICGQMKPVFEQVGQIKSHVLSFDAIVSLREARKHLGDRLLMGNISTYAVEFSEPEKIKELTQTAMESGADIISPACGLGMKSPLMNVQAILETVKGDKLCQE